MITFKGNYDYSEMDKVEKYLIEKKIRYRRAAFRDGEQITVFDESGQQAWDIVINMISYGHEENLLEAYGEALIGHDDVEGWLTAENVISFIETGKRGDPDEE